MPCDMNATTVNASAHFGHWRLTARAVPRLVAIGITPHRSVSSVVSQIGIGQSLSVNRYQFKLIADAWPRSGSQSNREDCQKQSDRVNNLLLRQARSIFLALESRPVAA